MLKRRSEEIQLIVRATDLVLSVVAFFSAFWLASRSRPGGFENPESISWILAASLGLHILLYPFFGFYESLRQKRVVEIISMIVRAFLTEFFVLGSLVFFLQAKTTSRYFFGVFLTLNYGLLLFEKLGVRALLSSLRRRGYNFRQVLIIGTGSNAHRVIRALQKNKHWGYLACGMLTESPGHPTSTVEGIPILGDQGKLESLVKNQTVDEVIFAQDRFDPEKIEEQVRLCETLGIPSRFSLGHFNPSHYKMTFGQLDSIPMLTFYRNLMTPTQSFLKRLSDICVSLVGLLLTGLLYPWISARIRRESAGPVIFKQVRVGENGRLFKCYKFRTMYPDAEARKQELVAQNQMEGPVFKIDNDPRITPFGAFLRRTSLDELPQFLNILRGDMSVVGTRPPTPDEVERYETRFRRRISIRPGLTGLWQVSGRNSVKRFEDILELDLEYIDNWSFWLDVQIILKTVWVALFRKGAY